MANTPMYDPKTSEARSSWLAGLTEACAKLSNSLNLKTTSVINLPLNELFISEDDRYRIYQAELGNKLWVSDPAPVIKQNGNIITPENNYFTIDYLGGSIAFEQGHTLDENDTITANVTYITGASSEIEALNAAIQAAQQSAGAFRGYYQTYDNLVADIDDPQIGNFAIVGGEDNSVYIWNITSKKWENTYKDPDLSDYYTIEQVDEKLEKKEDTIEAYDSTATADNYYYGGRKQWVNVFEKVLGTTLSGLVTTVAESVTEEDDILVAIGKLQAQIDEANKSISDNYDELTSSIDGLNTDIESIESTIAQLEASIKDKQPVKTTFTVTSDEWSDHSVTVNDDKILADTKYVYVLGLVGSSMDAYEGGSIWADDIASDGSITLHNKPDADIAVDLTFELIRFETSEEDTQPYGAKVISKILGGGGSVEGFRPASIKILTPPTTVQYYAGDIFVPDGMTVEITYENGAKLETTGYRWQPSGPLEYGTENVTVTFSENGGTVSIEQPITVIREAVEVPYQGAHLTFNKTVQQANFTNYDTSKMSVISGDISGKNADTYTATFHLSSMRYEWSDTHTTEDREVSWVIDKRVIYEPPYSDNSTVYNGSQITFSPYYDSEYINVSGDLIGFNAGIYYYYFNLTYPNDTEWDSGNNDPIRRSWNIPRFSIQKVPSTDDLEYNEKKQTPIWRDYDPEQLQIGGDTFGTEINTYTTTFTPIQPNYQWSDGSIEAREVQWKIYDPITIVTVPYVSGSITYNGTTQKPVWVNFDQDHTDISGETEGINAKQYTARFTLHERCEWATGGNEPKNITWSINKAVGNLSATPTTVTLDNDHLSVDVTVNTNSDGKITATPKDTSVATTSINGKTVTVSAVESSSGGSTIGSMSVGDTVSLNVDGKATDFIIVNQGNPDASLYDSSCDGTWLLMKDCYGQRQWNSSNVNDYENSTINAYLNNEFINKFDNKVKSAIKNVKIPYRPGSGTSKNVNSGSDGLSCKVFLLSGREMGWTTTDSQYFPVDGVKLSYFESSTSATANNKRIAKFNNSVVLWSLRSPYLLDRENTFIVDISGVYAYYYCINSGGIRPCIILPKDFNPNPPSYNSGTTTVTISVDEGTNWTKPSDASVAVNAEFAPTGKMAAEYNVGDSVFLNVSGVKTEFLVVNQGKPSNSTLYDDSCDGTWLLMKDCYGQRQWNNENVNDYEKSTINAYLNNEFINKFDSSVKSAISSVKIPYRPGSSGYSVNSGSKGLQVKIFLLSGREVNFDKADLIYTEGYQLDYFASCSTDSACSTRIANLNGQANIWLLRSPYTSSVYGSWAVSKAGSWTTNACSTSQGIRPAFILSPTALFNPTTNEFVGVATTLTAQLKAEIYMSNHIIDTMSAMQEVQTKENNQNQANIDYLSMMTGIDLPNEEPEQPVLDEPNDEEGDTDE